MSAKSAKGTSSLWEFLASIKLAVTLFILLALGSVLGTLIPQGQPAAFYSQYASVAWAKVILAAQLDHVYSSLWFLLLAAGLAANLIVCSLNRLPGALKAVRNTPRPEELRLPKVRLARTLVSPLGAEEAFAAARKTAASFQGFDGKPVESAEPDQEGGRLIFAQSGRFSRLGAYVVHLAILILMAGGLMTALFGFKGQVWLHQDQVIDQIRLTGGQVMDLDFQVRLDKFIFEKYKDGTPKKWQSDLSFIRGGKVVEKGRALVNHPHTFGGVTFYMSSFDQEVSLDWIELEVGSGREPAERLKVFNGKPETVEGLGRIEILDYDPNWRGSGFAAKIGLLQEGQDKPREFWVRPRPPFQMPPQGPGAPSFKLTEARAKKGDYYPGLQANYDPGIGFIWVGGIVMLLGLIAALFWSHQRLWVEVTPHQGGSRVVLAGATQRNRPSFELRFKSLVRELQESLAGSETGNNK